MVQDEHPPTEKVSLISNEPTMTDPNDNDHSHNTNTNNHQDIAPSTITNTNTNTNTQSSILNNFLLFSVFFSLNHGGVVSCLSLATARLGGNLGSVQSGVLYGSYTLSSLLGAAYVVKRLGGCGKGALVLGMWVYCAYVGCFALASFLDDDDGRDDYGDGTKQPTVRTLIVVLGGLLGGIGGGFLWMAQGTYFARVSAAYAAAASRIDDTDTTRGERGESEGLSDEPFIVSDSTGVKNATALLGGRFAAIYLGGEVAMRLFSTTAISVLGWEWTTVFVAYFLVALISTFLTTTLVTSYTDDVHDEENNDVVHTNTTSINATSTAFHKATATYRLLTTDYRVKYLVLPAIVFALSAAFLTSFVNGEVLPLALNDPSSIYVGVLGSVTSAVAAASSLLLVRLVRTTGNGPVLMGGCIAMSLPSALFLARPDRTTWGVTGLVLVYALQGIGRSTFEGTLRAEFASVFDSEREGAFGNLALWNGLVSVVGFFYGAEPGCFHREDGVSRYCVEYRDGSVHDVLIFELAVVIAALVAVGGLWRVAYLRKREEEEEEENMRSGFALDVNLL